MSEHALLTASGLNVAYPVARSGPFGRRQYIRPVDQLSLEVAAGETLGLVGESGSGKSTLGRLLVAVERPNSGSVIFDGEDVTTRSAHQRAREGLGRTFQTSSIFPLLTVHENVRLAAEADLGGSMRIWRRPGRFRPALERAAEALDAVGLSAHSMNIAAALSHGDKRRLEIAIVLASNARTILLDEPMAGMATENVAPLTELIRDLSKVHGKTVLMVEHHMHVVLGVADRVAVLHHGQLLACDTPELVMANPTVQSAYLGQPL